MAAHPVVCRSYSKQYSKAELEASRGVILDALKAPEALTGEQLDGVSYQFAPKTAAELVQELENIEGAINLLDIESNEAVAVSEIASRFFDFSTRALE